jgi:hypothetical protein
MTSPYTRDKLENWVGDFCGSDAIRNFGSIREYAQDLLLQFMLAACEHRDLEPEDLEEADLKAALLDRLARLNVPASIKSDAPALCAAFLTQLEAEGRLGGGRLLGAYVKALKESFDEKASGKKKPITNPGSRIGRNDPCPCGSGRKYKKCCAKD